MLGYSLKLVVNVVGELAKCLFVRRAVPILLRRKVELQQVEDS